MLARAHAFTIEGLHTRHVTVEVDVRAGLPGFAIVGLADAAVREARERIQAAILNSGFAVPARRITANLAPGDVRKAGPGLDLAIACALLAATGQAPPRPLARLALFGELALDGAVRPSRGALAVAHATRRAGLPALALAGGGAHEALLIERLQVRVVEHLRSAVRLLDGGAGDPLPARPPARAPRGALGGVSSCSEDARHGARAREDARARRGLRARPGAPGARAGDGAEERTGPEAELAGLDLADVRGQRQAVRTIVIAAAGAHNALLSGPPGTGKTMLAQRLASILPPLGPEEAVEVARIRSLTGERVRALATRRPFRAPHHSITAAGLVGGAPSPRAQPGACVGEAVLAHNGVLFLDELSEFSRATLQALRQPLEEGRVAIARARHSAVYPARFMLIAATNPCPCGHAGDGERCRCGEAEMARHRRRLSGPLLDRIDLLACMHRETAPDPACGAGGEAPTSSARAREQVLGARERQAARLAGEGVAVNARMDGRLLARHARLDERGQEMLRLARERGLLSARGEHRALRVARTIADLDASERVRARDLGAALALRPDVALAGGGA